MQKATRIKTLAVILALGVVGLACGETTGGQTSSGGGGTTSPSAPSVTATKAPTKAPAQTFDFKGNSAQNTKDFVVSGPEWTVKWTCDSTPQYGIAPTFGYNIGTVSGDQMFDSVLVTCDSAHSSGESTEHGSGTYYFQVETSTGWTIHVTDSTGG